jgi:hypothetical protein
MSQPTVSRRIESGVSELREKLKRRGIIVAATALGSLVTQNAAPAAPAIVLKDLGKIALAGAQAVTTSGVTSSAAGSTAATAGVLTGVKAKIITAAAVAAVGVGGVVTYKQVTRQPTRSGPSARVAKPAANTKPKKTVNHVLPERPDRIMTAVTPEAPTVGAENTTPDEPVPNSSPDKPAAETTSTEAPHGGGYGGGMGGYRRADSRMGFRWEQDQQEGPNDSEDEDRGRLRDRR